MALPFKKNSKKNKSKTVPRNVQKAFAISSFIATSLSEFKKEGGYEEVVDREMSRELGVLEDRALKSMSVYHSVTPKGHYEEFSKILADIWGDLAKRNNNKVDFDSIPAFVELLGFLIPPKDYYDTFKLKPFVRDRHIYIKDYPILCLSILEMAEELNNFLGTKQYALMKPKEKIVKEKKQKDKSKKAKTIPAKSDRNARKRVERVEAKKRNLSGIRAMAEKARKRNEEENYDV